MRGDISRRTAEQRRTQSRSRPEKTARKEVGRGRRVEAAARRQAILDAALSTFAEAGYEAARLDDVAARAGVAKGTLYLYFKDKEELFEGVISGAVAPVIERLSALASSRDLPTDAALEKLYEVFEREILGTRRKLLLRLIIAEGPRFPRIAEFYYRNVVGQVMPLIAGMAKRGAKRGELPTDALARFPQLIAAPLLLAVIWDALFSRIQPLDAAGFFRAHRGLLTGKTRRAPL